MKKMARTVIVGASLSLLAMLLIAMLATVSPNLVVSTSQTVQAAQPDLTTIPQDLKYTGPKACGACHFKEYQVWQKTAHFKGFSNMPPKYQRGSDKSCFTCHITGYGHPGGYKGGDTAGLLGVTCEACHGPGSAHEAAAKPFAKVDPATLTEAQKTEINASLLPADKACVACHITQKHEPHPEYEGQAAK